MSLTRRASARENTAPVMPPPPAPETMRQRLSRFMTDRHKTIGPSGPPAPLPAAPRLVFADEPDQIAHEAAVGREIAAIDEHMRAITARLDSGAAGDYELAELAAERRALATLRGEIAADLGRPILADRDGKPVSDRMRAFVRARSVELREQCWAAAVRAAAEGDHRRARALRRDALRARHLAEREVHLRGAVPGYSSPG